MEKKEMEKSMIENGIGKSDGETALPKKMRAQKPEPETHIPTKERRKQMEGKSTFGNMLFAKKGESKRALEECRDGGTPGETEALALQALFLSIQDRWASMRCLLEGDIEGAKRMKSLADSTQEIANALLESGEGGGECGKDGTGRE